MQETIDKTGHICQNCGAELSGKFCSNCGQDSSLAFNRSIFYIIIHFLEELFVWDSRIFRSVKYLFTKPGFLTYEYISGKINSYISPLKMFLFTSLVLFFIMIQSDPDHYKSMISESEEDDYFVSFVIEQQKNSSSTPEVFKDNFNDQFNDNITLYLLLTMLIFSLLLKLLYFTRKYYYSEHLVFTLHFFTFVLWCLLAGGYLERFVDELLFFFLYFVPGIYLFFSVKRVYHKSFWGAFLAAGFMTVSYGILISIWILGSVMLSAYRAA